jgi:hypothetical protein
MSSSLKTLYANTAKHNNRLTDRFAILEKRTPPLSSPLKKRGGNVPPFAKGRETGWVQGLINGTTL